MPAVLVEKYLPAVMMMARFRISEAGLLFFKVPSSWDFEFFRITQDEGKLWCVIRS